MVSGKLPKFSVFQFSLVDIVVGLFSRVIENADSKTGRMGVLWGWLYHGVGRSWKDRGVWRWVCHGVSMLLWVGVGGVS